MVDTFSNYTHTVYVGTAVQLWKQSCEAIPLDSSLSLEIFFSNKRRIVSVQQNQQRR